MDPEYGPVLVEMIRRFVDAPSFSAVADWINERGIPTTQDIARMRSAAGQSTTRLVNPKPLGKKWTPTAVQSVLTSRSLLGEYQRADGSVVRNDDGSPVMRSTPVLNETEWAALQDAVQSVKYKKPRGSSSPLVGVTFCVLCQNPLYYVKGDPVRGVKDRYRCQGNKSKGIPPCKGQKFKADDIHSMLQESLLGSIGQLEVMESRTKVDDSRAAKLAVIDGKMNQLNKEFQKGAINATAYASMISAQAADREKVAMMDGPKPVTEWTPTGETYAEWWERSTVDERREFLRKHGVKAYAKPGVMKIDPGDLVVNLWQQGAKASKSAELPFATVMEALERRRV
jgi:hypothetical protein